MNTIYLLKINKEMNKKMYRVIMAAMLLMGGNCVANAQLQGLINRGKQALKNEVRSN